MFSQIKKRMESEDFHEYLIDKCRVCLKSGNISIYESHDTIKNMVEFGAIEISVDDKFPQFICNSCQLLLDAAVMFRRKAQQTHAMLKNSKCFKLNSENEDLKYQYIVDKLTFDPSVKKYLTYATSDSDHVESETRVNNADFDDESIIDDTKTEKEYLLVSEESDNEHNFEQLDSDKKDSYLIIVSDSEQQKNAKDEFACNICSMIFRSMGELENHNEIEHKIKVPDKTNCAVCGEIVSKAYYKLHIKLHREKYKKKTKKHSKVECKVCNKTINKSYYNYHMKMHGPQTVKAERSRTCTLCNKTYGMNYYNDHMRRVHMLEPNGEKAKSKIDPRKLKHVQCPVCDKSISEHKYKQHLANHGKPPRKYVCDHCGKEFIYRSGFMIHLLTHGGDLKYKCQFCEYRAVHLGLLKVHVRTHTGDYNYKCAECPARFTTKSNLSQHIKRHKGPGHIKCYDCDKMFHRQRNMEEHHKTIHLKIKDVKCDICGKGFSHRDRMLSHQLKIHNRDRLPKNIMASYLKIEKEPLQNEKT